MSTLFGEQVASLLERSAQHNDGEPHNVDLEPDIDRPVEAVQEKVEGISSRERAMQAIVESGGNREDWKVEFEGDAEGCFKGGEWLNAKTGLSETKIIRETLDADKVSQHEEVLSTWKENPEHINITEWIDEKGIFHKTASWLEGDGPFGKKINVIDLSFNPEIKIPEKNNTDDDAGFLPDEYVRWAESAENILADEFPQNVESGLINIDLNSYFEDKFEGIDELHESTVSAQGKELVSAEETFQAAENQITQLMPANPADVAVTQSIEKVSTKHDAVETGADTNTDAGKDIPAVIDSNTETVSSTTVESNKAAIEPQVKDIAVAKMEKYSIEPVAVTEAASASPILREEVQGISMREKSPEKHFVDMLADQAIGKETDSFDEQTDGQVAVEAALPETKAEQVTSLESVKLAVAEAVGQDIKIEKDAIEKDLVETGGGEGANVVIDISPAIDKIADTASKTIVEAKTIIEPQAEVGTVSSSGELRTEPALVAEKISTPPVLRTVSSTTVESNKAAIEPQVKDIAVAKMEKYSIEPVAVTEAASASPILREEVQGISMREKSPEKHFVDMLADQAIGKETDSFDEQTDGQVAVEAALPETKAEQVTSLESVKLAVAEAVGQDIKIEKDAIEKDLVETGGGEGANVVIDISPAIDKIADTASKTIVEAKTIIEPQAEVGTVSSSGELRTEPALVAEKISTPPVLRKEIKNTDAEIPAQTAELAADTNIIKTDVKETTGASLPETGVVESERHETVRTDINIEQSANDGQTGALKDLEQNAHAEILRENEQATPIIIDKNTVSSMETINARAETAGQKEVTGGNMRSVDKETKAPVEPISKVAKIEKQTTAKKDSNETAKKTAEIFSADKTEGKDFVKDEQASVRERRPREGRDFLWLSLGLDGAPRPVTETGNGSAMGTIAGSAVANDDQWAFDRNYRKVSEDVENGIAMFRQDLKKAA